MRGHRVEHGRTARRDDDLQVVAQGELPQLQHEQLLYPGVQPGLHLVDQDQRAVELGISCARRRMARSPAAMCSSEYAAPPVRLLALQPFPEGVEVPSDHERLSFIPAIGLPC